MGPERSAAVAPQFRQVEGNNFGVMLVQIAQVVPRGVPANPAKKRVAPYERAGRLRKIPRHREFIRSVPALIAPNPSFNSLPT